jgi:hypothetical protein
MFIAFVPGYSCRKEKANVVPLAEKRLAFFPSMGTIGSTGNSSLLTKEGDVVVCGNNFPDVFIQKFSKQGELIWRTEWRLDNICRLNGLIQSNNEYFLAGLKGFDHVTVGSNWFLLKLNSDGDSLWSITYRHQSSLGIDLIIKTSDGNLLLTGYIFASDTLPSGQLLMKTDLAGNILWEKVFTTQYCQINSMIETSNHDYLLSGSISNYNDDFATYFIKVKSSGEKIWDKQLSDFTDKNTYSTIEVESGNFVSCGIHMDPTSGYHYSQVYIFKTDQDGQILWEQEFGEANVHELANVIVQREDKTFDLAGISYVHEKHSNALMLHTNSRGETLAWKRLYGDTACSAENLLKNNNNLIITGNATVDGIASYFFMSIINKNYDYVSQ